MNVYAFHPNIPLFSYTTFGSHFMNLSDLKFYAQIKFL